jgi:transcriptional regulator with XRE-family HTH domain
MRNCTADDFRAHATLVVVDDQAPSRLNGKKVRELRERAGIKSQSELARRLKIKPSTVQRWEDGSTAAPETPTLLSLARELRTSIDYLLDRPEPLAPRKRELLDEIRKVFGRSAADALERMDRLTDHHRAILSGRIEGWSDALEDSERIEGQRKLPPMRYDRERASHTDDESITDDPRRELAPTGPAEPAGGEATR